MIWKAYVEKDVFQSEILCLPEKVIKKIRFTNKAKINELKEFLSYSQSLTLIENAWELNMTKLIK